MKITDTSLRRPVTVIVLTIALVYFGIYAYFNMGMEQTPDVDLPVVMVTTTMRGATAAVMDNDVTDVLEEQTAEALDGVVDAFRINWVWMPPWGPDRITDDGRDMMRALGFAI